MIWKLIGSAWDAVKGQEKEIWPSIFERSDWEKIKCVMFATYWVQDCPILNLYLGEKIISLDIKKIMWQFVVKCKLHEETKHQ